MAEPVGGALTLTMMEEGRAARLPALRVSVTPPNGPAVTAPLGVRPLVIGTSAECDLTVADPRMSRRHCELRLTARGVALRDLDSKNGVLVGEMPVSEGFLPALVPARLGGSTLVVVPESGATILPLSRHESYGDAVGASLAMRAVFAMLERAAPTDETILLLGESGTGKEVLARAIHANSHRRTGPFAVVDCGALAPTLVESELFGHVAGAATGLTSERTGLLEQANGGTVLIDEIGEMPLDLQPKLLRAIESREVRKVGSNKVRPFDARIVAATHRNLAARARDGSFRADLYFRLSVVEIHVPALRDRKDDIPLLVNRFLAARRPPVTLADLPPTTMALLRSHDWPGNVRELRNTVSRLLLFPEMVAGALAGQSALSGAPPASPSSVPPAPPAESDGGGNRALLELPLPEARELVMEQFERRYVTERLARHAGNVSRAAESMGISRQLLHRLIERYGLRAK
jgi:DNA-binding NtrC family response regulator